MLIGYARVSRQGRQDTAIQIEALKKAGVDQVFEEKASGGGGTGLNYIERSINYDLATYLSFGSSIVYHDPSKIY